VAARKGPQNAVRTVARNRLRAGPSLSTNRKHLPPARSSRLREDRALFRATAQCGSDHLMQDTLLGLAFSSEGLLCCDASASSDITIRIGIRHQFRQLQRPFWSGSCRRASTSMTLPRVSATRCERNPAATEPIEQGPDCKPDFG
jgi:hypothetical protein